MTFPRDTALSGPPQRDQDPPSEPSAPLGKGRRGRDGCVDLFSFIQTPDGGSGCTCPMEQTKDRVFPAGILGLEPQWTFPDGSQPPLSHPRRPGVLLQRTLPAQGAFGDKSPQFFPIMVILSLLELGFLPPCFAPSQFSALFPQFLPSSPIFLSPPERDDTNSFRLKGPQPTGRGSSSCTSQLGVTLE